MAARSAQAREVTQGPNPAISGEAIRNALGTDQAASATGRAVDGRQAELDEAELRDLERAEYFGGASTQIEPLEAPAGRRRRLLDWFLRR